MFYKKTLSLDKTYLDNASQYLNIPTYDGSNQCVHSKTLYFDNGWNGYKFWMVFTPLTYYPSINENIENPCIVVSNDSVNWTVPNGLINPIDNIKKENLEYNSDTHIVMNGDTMEVWYRHFSKNPRKETIYKKVSTDGIHWSTRIKLLESNGTDGWLLSPAVIYNDDIYKVWFVGTLDYNTYLLRYYESLDGINLMHIRDMQLSEIKLWHIDVIKNGELYELVANVKNRQSCIYSCSLDNKLWSNCSTILKVSDNNWDKNGLYRPSLTIVNSIYYFYYTGINYKHSGARQGLIILDK
ncbi:MAG: hypothetical protein ACRDA3_00755 [Peptostreptococcaceae bacterium]